MINPLEFFDKYQIRIDPWETDYKGPLQIDQEFDDTQKDVNPSLEVNINKWEPISSDITFSDSLNWGPLTFIDGVRGMILRLTGYFNDQIFYGGFGSTGVGALTISYKNQIELSNSLQEGSRVQRYCLMCGTDDIPEELIIKGLPGNIKCLNILENTQDSSLKELQKIMRNNEASLADSLSHKLNGLMIVDGPLPQGFPEKRLPIIGYIKTFRTLYLPDKLIPILFNLKIRERTPLFTIGEDKWSWFMRLSKLEESYTPLAGLVRLELSSRYSIEKARVIADRLTGILPELSTSRIKDPRAPQNLIPIHALENYLRHLMGNRLLVRRKLENSFFSG